MKQENGTEKESYQTFHSPKVKLNIVGMPESPLYLLYVFKKRARIEGWTDAEIAEVVNEAIDGGHEFGMNRLICVISEHCEEE